MQEYSKNTKYQFDSHWKLISYKTFEVVKALLDGGADPNKEETGHAPLMLVFQNTSYTDTVSPVNIEMARLLLDAGADPNWLHSTGVSLLFIAVYDNKTEAVKLLLEAGADPNKVGPEDLDNTPLCVARHKRNEDNPEMVELLIEAGAK